MDILRQTLRTTQTVASAMAGVVGFWSKGVTESRCQFGVANQVNDIESEFSNVGTLMMRSRTYIYEHWLDIEQNICYRLRLLNIWNASRYFYIN